MLFPPLNHQMKDFLILISSITVSMVDICTAYSIQTYLSTFDLKEHKLELNNSGTISILCNIQD